MRNEHGSSGSCSKRSTPHSLDASVASSAPSQSMTAFDEFVHLYDGPKAFSTALQIVHDLALYHSHSLIDNQEKQALFKIKLLQEFIDQIPVNA